jgi:hypothetical protein
VSTELRISSISPFFQCPRVRPCECGCIHEDSLLPIPPGGFNFSVDGALVDAWSYIPGFKVGNIHLYILPLWLLSCVDFKSLCSMEYDYSMFHLVVFVFLSQGSLDSSSVEPLQIRPVFVPRNFVYRQTIKFRNCWTWNTWSKVKLEQLFVFSPRGVCRHTSTSWFIITSLLEFELCWLAAESSGHARRNER